MAALVRHALVEVCTVPVLLVVLVIIVCFSELFLMNFTTRSLPAFHRSSVAAPARSCHTDDTANQFHVVELTADTFSSVVLDPTKVTSAQLRQSLFVSASLGYYVLYF